MTDSLPGGRFSGPAKEGQTVVRKSSGPNAAALLQHLERSSFDLAPRFISTANGLDTLSYLPGTAGLTPFTDDVRSEEALTSVATAIRRLHDHTQGFQPPAPTDWRVMDVALPVEVDCIGHHDLSPWNLLFRGRQVVGIIDWDTIAPSNRMWDLAFAAYQLVPLYPPAWLDVFGWPAEPDRRRRLHLLANTYGLGAQPAELIDLALVRLASLAAHMETQIRRGDPAYAVMRDEDHAGGLRASVAWLSQNRKALT
ncbi:phosphotransferase [Kineococcus sp. NBC_00420]|uniref:phosphotransferase n=1 Tax=Kineococcus sp. NBC_00420 TaxID=2903564 RepID=UPI002E1E250F